MQSRLGSLVEQLFNTGSGFIVSVLVWHFIVQPFWGIKTSFAENLNITLLFTVVSIARSYVWRRFFNGLAHKNNKKSSHDETHRNHGPLGKR